MAQHRTPIAGLALTVTMLTPCFAQATGAPPSGVWAATPGATMMRSPEDMGIGGKAGTVSAAAAAPLREVSRALTAKRWADAIAACKKAGEVMGLTPYDRFMISYFYAVAYYGEGDAADAARSYEEAAASPAASADLRNAAILSAISLENDAKHDTKVVELVKAAEAAAIADEHIYDTGAVAAYDLGNDAEAASLIQKAVDVASKAGGEPAEVTYHVQLMIALRQKDGAGQTRVLEALCRAYGGKQDWANLVNVALGGLDEKSPMAEIASLYMLRLRVITGAPTETGDYMLLGELAMAHASPGDAERALQAGVAAGVLAGNAQAAALLAQADKRAAADQRVLAGLEERAGKAKNGDAALALGEAYFGYGRYGDAIRMANAALAKGTKEAPEARLLLGASEAMQGDAAASLASLNAVGGDSATQSAAHLWAVYAARKYGVPAAAHS